MLVFTIRRLLQSVFVLAVMSMLVFAGVYAVGNPIDILISPEATQADREATVRALGLDKPLWLQYFFFVKGALALDLGKSFAYNVPAIELIFERMPATLELASSAMLMAVVIGLPLGLYAGLKPKSWISKTIMTLSIFGFSLPTFWIGLMLIMIFAVFAGVLPSNGRGTTAVLLGIPVSFLTLDGLRHLLLPAFTLALLNIALIIRLVRAGAQEAMLMDYVKFARAKGLSDARIIGVHVLKNILIPVVTVIALQFGSVIAFAVVTETIFAWPGMGKLLIDSINVLDRPVIVAYLLIIVTLFIFINLLVDIAYSLLDPRVRLGDAEG